MRVFFFFLQRTRPSWFLIMSLRFKGYFYLRCVEKHQEAVHLLRRGIDANPFSVVLNLALVETLEFSLKSVSGNKRDMVLYEIRTSFNRLTEHLRLEASDLHHVNMEMSSCMSSSVFGMDEACPNPEEKVAVILGNVASTCVTPCLTIWTAYHPFFFCSLSI